MSRQPSTFLVAVWVSEVLVRMNQHMLFRQDRLSETWHIYVVGYIVLEDEMGDSKIDKEGT